MTGSLITSDRGLLEEDTLVTRWAGKCVCNADSLISMSTCVTFTLMINQRMCQLPLGNQERRVCRWVRRLGISVAVQASLLPMKGVLTSLYSRIPTANIQRRANWTQLSGARRAQRESFYGLVVHMRTVCLPFPER